MVLSMRKELKKKGNKNRVSIKKGAGKKQLEEKESVGVNEGKDRKKERMTHEMRNNNKTLLSLFHLLSSF